MWAESLRNVWTAHQGETDQWGVLDCCQFIREYVLDLTGRDYGGDLVYGTREEAFALMEAHGGLVGLLTDILGPPKAEAEAGDVVVAKLGPEARGAGVYAGQWVIGVIPDRGVVRYRAPVVAAWTCRKP